MKTITFCKKCRKEIGKEMIAFIEMTIQNLLVYKTPSFIDLDSKDCLEMAKELEEKRYIVTHELEDRYIAVLPLNIEPKVNGCHLYCKNREEKIEKTTESEGSC